MYPERKVNPFKKKEISLESVPVALFILKPRHQKYNFFYKFMLNNIYQVFKNLKSSLPIANKIII